MADTPNLFPGLSAEDRARLASIAGNLETLPELLDRLMGYTNDIAKVRPPSQGLVGPGPFRAWPLATKPLEPGTGAPISVDTDGLQLVRSVRRGTDLGDLVIPENAQESNSISLAAFGGGAILSVALAVFDDPTARAAGEVISVYGSYVDDPAATFYLGASNVLGATYGVIGFATAALSVCARIRLRSAVPVAGRRSFRLIAQGG